MDKEHFEEKDLTQDNTATKKEEQDNKTTEENMTNHKEDLQQDNNIATEKEDNKEQEEVMNENEVAEEKEVTEEEEKEENPQEEIIEIKASEVEKLKNEFQETKDKYIRLYSEFENFRRRTAKEKLELIKTANEDLIIALLPVIDDFQRAKKSFEEKSDSDSLLEGFNLIYNKTLKVLEQKGLKRMEVEKGNEFDTEFHDAISQIPAPEEKFKGKIIDVVEEGYFLGDKVIRFAKVVIGA